MAKVEIVGETKLPREDVKMAVASAVRARWGEVEESTARLERSISGFEAAYHMSTEEFLRRYSSGVLGENVDFMEWRACKEILDDLLAEKALLGEILD
jgi:hypothetical protein